MQNNQLISPEIKLEDIAYELQNEYESRRYMQAQRQRTYEQRIAGDVLLLQEIFREKK